MKKKMSINVIGTSISRNDMKKIMAGSGPGDPGGGGSGGSCEETNAVFCRCTWDGQVLSACASFDGSSPYNKCAQLVCGGMVYSASWGIDWFCSNCP